MLNCKRRLTCFTDTTVERAAVVSRVMVGGEGGAGVETWRELLGGGGGEGTGAMVIPAIAGGGGGVADASGGGEGTGTATKDRSRQLPPTLQLCTQITNGQITGLSTEHTRAVLAGIHINHKALHRTINTIFSWYGK